MPRRPIGAGAAAPEKSGKKEKNDSMTGAMYAAIGGLKSHMSKLNVIGNNIANCNTFGYKAARASFRESMYATVTAGSNGGVTSGGVNPSQIGYGCSIGSIDLNMATSTYSPSGIDMDCMLTGEGFFLVGDKGATSADQLELTRVGDFFIDPEGFLCDRAGRVVYGFASVQNPDYNPKATKEEQAKNPTWNEPTIISTQLVALRVPLAATAPTEDNKGIVDGETKWLEGDAVYDVLSERNDQNKQFNLSADRVQQPDGDSHFEDQTEAEEKAKSTIEANAEGTRVQLQAVKVGNNGIVTGTNSKTKGTVTIGVIAVATVDNPSGVTHMGGPYYKAMEGAGDLRINALGGTLDGRYLDNQVAGTAPGGAGGAAGGDIKPPTANAIGNGGKTEIKSGGLEASGTDIATEFSEMITTQRGYQANTRIITVTDSMLEELVNMKR